MRPSRPDPMNPQRQKKPRLSDYAIETAEKAMWRASDLQRICRPRGDLDGFQHRGPVERAAGNLIRKLKLLIHEIDEAKRSD
jgi:hypothetical protein